MSRILFATVSAAGHVSPGLGIARALVQRGHEVAWYTGRRYRAAVERVGARFLPLRAARDFDDGALDAEFPGRGALRGLAQFKFDMRHVFIDSVPAYVADLERITAEERFDGFVNDVGFVAMNLFCEREGLAQTVYGITALPFPSRDTAPFGAALPPSQTALGRLRNGALNLAFDRLVFRDVNRRYAALRQSLGLRAVRTGSFFSDSIGLGTFLQASVPSFDYPRTDLPDCVRFIGPMPAARAPFDPPAWWDELDGSRPVVHVTQGTVATEPKELLLPTLHALQDEEVIVVATTGGRPVESLGRLPKNARVATFIPHAELLPRTRLMITNAGFGGVQTALAHGVPLIAAGGSEEKPEIAARVAFTGAGIDLRTGRPSPATIRAAVRTLLREPSYTEHARRMQQESTLYDAPTLAAEAVERVLPETLARNARRERGRALAT